MGGEVAASRASAGAAMIARADRPCMRAGISAGFGDVVPAAAPTKGKCAAALHDAAGDHPASVVRNRGKSDQFAYEFMAAARGPLSDAPLRARVETFVQSL